MYGPYTGRHFASRGETDISHIVALSEAHDSGLCAVDAGTRRRFASDLLKLTLAGPEVNRHDKWAHDAGEWLPPMNRCWFAARVVAVKHKYRLTVDAREARALEGVLSRCASTAMVVTDGREAVGHERERAHHLPRGARARHRPGAARTPGLLVHARRRRGRRGVRVKARTGMHCRQPGNGGGES